MLTEVLQHQLCNYIDKSSSGEKLKIFTLGVHITFTTKKS